MPQFHGVRTISRGEGEFYFASLRIFNSMLTPPFYSVQTLEERNWPKWSRQWRHRKCLQAATKYQDTFWKVIRAGDYLSDAISIVRDLKDSRTSENAGRFASALSDIPLYLDMLWVYLRIHADVFATLVSFLYEERGAIPDRSFRAQRRWFMKTRGDFDPAYRNALSRHSQWFDDLAGQEPKGIRDIIIHQRGTYQLGWTEPAEGEEFKIEASLVRDAGIVSNDVIPTLISVVAGYCEFLDEWTRVTVDRLKPVFGYSMELPNIARKPYFSYGGGALACEWMFPKLQVEDLPHTAA
jgi:hypothetical protein